jgi:DNA-binding GntR family transcriptional regulator
VERALKRQRTSRKPLSRKPAVRGRKSLRLQKILRPLVGDSHRRAAVDIHRYLRDSILANTLPPDTVLSQVEVAGCLKVSRTPVREAFRMLQEEGLISAEPNYRCRVLGFNPEELELLYASRIMNEGISAAVTVAKMSEVDFGKLNATFEAMRKAEEQEDFSRWIVTHRAFHQMLFSGANARLQQRMYEDCQRSERYMYNSRQSGLIGMFHRAAVEHEDILKACARRQPALVASMLTSHLTRAGVDILKALAPRWEPITLQSAARFMLCGAAHLDDWQDRDGGGASVETESVAAALPRP